MSLRYSGGWNPAALAATVAGILPSLPGFLSAIGECYSTGREGLQEHRRINALSRAESPPRVFLSIEKVTGLINLMFGCFIPGVTPASRASFGNDLLAGLGSFYVCFAAACIYCDP